MPILLAMTRVASVANSYDGYNKNSSLLLGSFRAPLNANYSNKSHTSSEGVKTTC
jgi:hypothetical protein